MLKVTTSWDDGDILDLRLANLLSQYGIKGTFYITKNYREKRLSEDEIRKINTNHEIGAHTLSHPDLRTLSYKEKQDEIEGGKKWLEEIIQGPVNMFCYPKGLYDTETAHVVQNIGFLGARTTKLGSIETHADPFQIETTLQVYPFPFRKINQTKYYFGKLFEPYTQRSSKLRDLGVSRFKMYSWLSLAKATFDIAVLKGDTFHLWGHSWEIEKYDMWNELEKFLQYIQNHKNCAYLTNREVL
ncbi:MAG: hypothetical protein RJA61_576 [Candidatus Parcubacteria bacterium]|jgi:peptidoglycan/xylan/chitin deacetylase (PgdA/CDA1 family)